MQAGLTVWGVVILELCLVQVAERGMGLASDIDLIDKAGKI